jgi:hypothetical protein
MSYFNDTDELTQLLGEDLSGANGDLTKDAVFANLIDSIRKATGIYEGDAIPIDNVARLLLAMHEHMLGDHFHLMAMCKGWEPPELNERWDLRRSIMLMLNESVARSAGWLGVEATT